MIQLKKGKYFIKEGEIPKKIFYIREGRLTDGNKEYLEGTFISIVSYILQLPIAKSLKSLSNIKIEEFDDFNDIDDSIIKNFIQEISKITNNLMYFPIEKSYADPNKIINYKLELFSNNNDEEYFDIEENDELKEFFDNFNFFFDKEEQIDLPESFEEYKKVLKNFILELNISKLINYFKKGLNKYEVEQSELEVFFDELIDIAITINDRALVLYLVYISAIKIENIDKINKYLKKNWEFLRFNGINNWVDYSMRYINNKMISEGDKI